MSRMDRYKKIHEESEKLEQAKKESFQPESEAESESHSRSTHAKGKLGKSADSGGKKGWLAVRKERKDKTKQSEKVQEKQPERFAEAEHDAFGEEPAVKKGFFTRKPKKPKRRSSLKKKIAIILIIFLALETGSFFLGKAQADGDSSIPQQELQSFDGVKAEDGSTNILLLGSDTREGETARADSIIVLHIGGVFDKPKMVSFMRDTYVNIPGVGYDKLNAAYAYGGADLLRQTLKNQFGVECRYYAIVDFQSFEKVIDALFWNGVKIDAEKSLELDGVNIEQGEQRMDGHTLLQYARFRMDEEGDFGRVRRQQQVMSEIFSQVKNPLTLLRAPYAGGKILGYTSTNVPVTFLASHGIGIARAGGGFDRLTVPVENSFTNQTYDVGAVLDIDEQMNLDGVQAFLAD